MVRKTWKMMGWMLIERGTFVVLFLVRVFSEHVQAAPVSLWLFSLFRRGQEESEAKQKTDTNFGSLAWRRRWEDFFRALTGLNWMVYLSSPRFYVVHDSYQYRIDQRNEVMGLLDRSSIPYGLFLSRTVALSLVRGNHKNERRLKRCIVVVFYYKSILSVLLPRLRARIASSMMVLLSRHGQSYPAPPSPRCVGRHGHMLPITLATAIAGNDARHILPVVFFYLVCITLFVQSLGSLKIYNISPLTKSNVGIASVTLCTTIQKILDGALDISTTSP